MIALTRRVRLHIASGEPAANSEDTNGYAGTPSPIGLPAYFELDVTCQGDPDPKSGYLINIARIDQAVRRIAPDALGAALRQGASASIPKTLHSIAMSLVEALPVPLRELTLRLSPSSLCTLETQPMQDQPTHILLTRSFSFASSHRLHNPALTDEQNREIFGKCNNPNGHGHNYRLDVTIRTPADTQSCSFASLDKIVSGTIMDRYDHKNLNIDTEDFLSTIPSVENIASRCFELLVESFASLHPQTSLHSIRVWETEKTFATVTAEHTPA